MNILEGLRSAGFTDNEIKIYLTLIDYGSSKVGRIVKITNIQKSSCYMALNSLMHKGIISSVSIGKVSFYKAEDPRSIVDFFDEKKRIMSEFLPSIEKRFKANNKKDSCVQHFKGIKGVKYVFNDILNEGKDNVVFGSEGQLTDKMPIYVNQYIRRQNELGMKTKNLVRKGMKRKYSKGTSYRFVDEKIESNVVTNIYGDKIAIIIWTDEPEAVIIENEVAAKSYKAYFDFMWKNAKK